MSSPTATTPPTLKSKGFLMFCCGLLAGLCLLGGFEWWRIYCRGHVMATAHAFSTKPFRNITAYIRAYPTDINPLLSDGRFYGCEVYADHILMSSAAFRFDSYTAETFHIQISPPNTVHFYIDDYHIQSDGIGWNGSTWTPPY